MFPMDPPFAFACGPADLDDPRVRKLRRRLGHAEDLHNLLFSAMTDERSGPDRSGRGRGRSRGRGRAPRGGWDARGGRVRRGDVRAAILALLAEQPRHGYEMIQELKRRTDGLWQPSPGSVYPTLSQLEDEGLVVATEVDAKRVFALTDAGRAEAESREGPTPWEEVADDAHAPEGDPEEMSIMAQTAHLMAAAKVLRHTSTPEQRRQAAAIIADARRRIYLLLAEEPTE